MVIWQAGGRRGLHIFKSLSPSLFCLLEAEDMENLCCIDTESVSWPFDRERERERDGGRWDGKKVYVCV